MGSLSPERRWRDALLDAMIPAPGNGLPAMLEVDRTNFWPRFDRSAPWHLRLGFRAATVAVVCVCPMLFGYRKVLTHLDPVEQDDVLHRADRLPGGSGMLMLVKLVACLAYFDSAQVQTVARGPKRG